MSYESETRVVELQFNNKQFEANVSQTLTSLDKLDAALKFDGAEKGFKDLEKAANKVNLDGLSSAVENIEARFTSLGGVLKAKTLDRLADGIIDFSRKTIKNLTIDQVTAGWGKYEQQVSAVQTILNSTGESMEDVSAQLEKLSWYTDETSYYFDDMVNNISKFTSQGIKMADATDQMIGIANAAGLAGVNAENAGHAMEGFAKAMSKGYMDRQNWTWIQTAKMETPKLKQLFIEVAEEQGKLQRITADTWKVADSKDHMVSVGNFLENMKDKWIDSDVMQEALRRYSSYTTRIYSIMELLGKEGYTTAQVMEEMGHGINASSGFVDDLTNAVNEYNKSVDNVEDHLDVMELLAQDWSELGEMGMRASQETKTFADMVGAIEEVISSGWRRSFDLIIGNYEEAKDMWSTFVEDIWDIFAEPAEARNELLQQWKDWGGRDDLIEGVRNLYTAVMSFVNPIKDAFRDIFPPKTAEDLVNLTWSFRGLTEKMILTEKQGKGLYSVFKTLFSILKPFVTILSNCAQVFGILVTALARLLKILLQNATGFDNFAEAMSSTGKIGSALRVVLIGLTLAIIAIRAPALLAGSALAVVAAGLYSIGAFRWLAQKIRTFFAFMQSTVIPALKSVGSWIASLLPSMEDVAAVFVKIGSGIQWVWEKVQGLGATLSTFWQNHLKNLHSIREVLSTIGNAIKGLFERQQESGEAIQQTMDVLPKMTEAIDTTTFSISDLAKKVQDSAARLRAWFSTVSVGQAMLVVFSLAILALIMNINELTKKVTTAIGTLTSFKDVFSPLVKYLNALTKATKYSGLMQLGIGLGIISASLIALTYANWDHLWEAAAVLGAFAAVGIVLTRMLGDATKMSVNTGVLSISLMAFAGSVMFLSNALWNLASIPWNTLGTNLIGLSVAFAALVGTMGGFIVFMKYMSKGWDSVKNVLNGATMISFAGSIYVLALAMKELAGLPDLANVTTAIIAVGGAFGFIMATTSRFKLGAGVGALAAVAAFRLFIGQLIGMTDELRRLQSYILSLDTSSFATLAVTFIGIAGIIGIAGKGFLAVGTGLLAGVLAIKAAVDTLGEIDGQTLSRAVNVINQLSGIFTRMSVIAGLFSILGNTFARIGNTSGGNLFTFGANKNPFKGMMSAFIGMGVMMVALSFALKVASTIKPETLEQVGAIFRDLTLAMAIALGAAGYAKGAAKAITSMTIAIGAMAGIVALMSFFTNEGISQLVEPAIILGSLMVALGLSLALASAASQRLDNKAIVGMAATAAAVAAYLYLMASTGTGWEELLPAATALGICLVTLGAAMAIAGTTAENLKIAPLLAMTAAAAVIGASLYFLVSTEASWEQMAAATAGFAAVLFALGSAIAIAGAHASNALGTSAAILAMAVTAYSVSEQLQKLALIGDWNALMSATTSFGIALIALCSGIAIASKDGAGALLTTPALLSAAVMSVAIGHALAQLANAGSWKEILVALGAFAGAIAVLVAAIEILGNAWQPALIGEAVLLVLAGAMEVFVLIVTQFVKQVDKFADAMDKVMLSLSGIQNTAPEAADALRVAVQDMKGSVEDARRTLLPESKKVWKEIGEWMAISLEEGMRAHVPSLKETGASLATLIENAFRNQSQIHSPSPIWTAIGNWIPKSISQGIDEKKAEAGNAVTGLGQSLLERFNIQLPSWFNAGQSLGSNLVSGIKSMLGGIKIGDKSLTTWFDELGLSNISNVMNGGSVISAKDPKDYKDTTDANTESTNVFTESIDDLAESFDLLTDAKTKNTGASAKNKEQTEEERIAQEKAAKEARWYADVTNFATETIRFNTKMLKANDATLSDTEAEEKAIEIVEQMILTHYKSTEAIDAECQMIEHYADLTQEQLIKAGEAWDEYYSGMLESAERGLSSMFDFFGDDPFDQQLGEALTSFDFGEEIYNMTRNSQGIQAAVNYMTQAIEKGLNPDIAAKLWEKADFAKIINYGKLSEVEIGLINKQYETFQNAMETGAQMVADHFVNLNAGLYQDAMEKSVTAATDYLESDGEHQIQESMMTVLQYLSNSTDPEAAARGMGLGRYWDDGIAQGITDMTDLCVYAVEQLANEMIAALRSSIQASYSTFQTSSGSIGGYVSSGGGGGDNSRGAGWVVMSDADAANLHTAMEALEKSQKAAIDKYGSFSAAEAAGAIESLSDVANRLGSDVRSTLEGLGKISSDSSSASATSASVNNSSSGSSSTSTDNSTNVTVNQTINSPAPVSQAAADASQRSAASRIASAIT